MVTIQQDIQELEDIDGVVEMFVKALARRNLYELSSKELRIMRDVGTILQAFRRANHMSLKHLSGDIGMQIGPDVLFLLEEGLGSPYLLYQILPRWVNVLGIGKLAGQELIDRITPIVCEKILHPIFRRWSFVFIGVSALLFIIPTIVVLETGIGISLTNSDAVSFLYTLLAVFILIAGLVLFALSDRHSEWKIFPKD